MEYKGKRAPGFRVKLIWEDRTISMGPFNSRQRAEVAGRLYLFWLSRGFQLPPHEETPI